MFVILEFYLLCLTGAVPIVNPSYICALSVHWYISDKKARERRKTKRGGISSRYG
ncbi:hypothetical protein BDV40DRAFT_268677 [Aspergillus tamarii]|uniref:Uncharacterized protein n=1 Tax=Aspergillus tamarii TaxID=41984 RepID=A0A5N6URB0_ASPTM|nr:hypothetical protein BDV40DRAFT_268677 [Aspergillus tamarii]